MSATNDHEACISICNGLLRGELSAVETYGKAIEKFSHTPQVEELRRIRQEHALSASLLSSNVRAMGGEPDKDSGAWGIFASAVQSTANLFGENSALHSLSQGEETGRKDYENALSSPDTMDECKAMIRTELLPPVLNHISALERLEKTV